MGSNQTSGNGDVPFRVPCSPYTYERQALAALCRPNLPRLQTTPGTEDLQESFRNPSISGDKLWLDFLIFSHPSAEVQRTQHGLPLSWSPKLGLSLGQRKIAVPDTGHHWTGGPTCGILKDEDSVEEVM